MVLINEFLITYGQDGEYVNETIHLHYNLKKGDTRYSSTDKKDKFDFVGFIINKNKTLAVFPKNYFSENKLEALNNGTEQLYKEIELLFDVMYHYINNEKTSATAQKHLGNDPEFVSDFPFLAFMYIYEYFKKFGIYKEITLQTKSGYHGRISWKTTIQKSNKIINSNNLIHIPLYMKKNKKKQVFISECMIFVIEYTLNRFPYFFSLPRTNHAISNFNFIGNREYVLSQLRNELNNVFKDIHKKLILNLINFFEQINIDSLGGDIHLKINYFDMVWEKMVEKYLNRYFVKVDQVKNQLIFNTDQSKSLLKFKDESFPVDVSNRNYTIRPDHYAKYNGNQYIFDSKYFDEVTELNYKQLSYHEILDKQLSDDYSTFSALLLPGRKPSRIHFQLSDSFLYAKQKDVTIIEHYLDVKKVMKKYIKK